MNLKEFFEKTNLTSSFAITISDIGGNITFSNSGRRGDVKQFTLGLESFISILKDINNNLIKFTPHENYVEKDWRDLGSQYYSDGPANAMSTVQTKPLFATLSKIIAWANSPDLDNLNHDQEMKISKETIGNTIKKLEELANSFRSKEKVDLDAILLKYKNLTFNEVKEKFSGYFEEIYEENKGWMTNVEDKLNLIKDEKDRVAVKDIIDKLKNSDYSFNESDNDNLSVFTRVIDRTLNVSNFINNFTVKNLERDGVSIHELFNRIKSSEKFGDLDDLKLSGTLKTIVPYLYSSVKYCQSPDLYPIYYKYWYTILGNILAKGTSYDDLTGFYRTFPEKNRLLNFCSYFGALGKAILFELKPFYSKLEKNSIDYRKILRLIPSKYYIAQIFELDGTANQNEAVSNFVDFIQDCLKSGYIISTNTVYRFITSILSKPFVILTGLSGSGKTKLAQAFTYWITESENQYCIIPVGADWTNREPLLGFPNALDLEKYIKPENGVVELLIEASKEENKSKPFFLILDEMNLSHVERYFADFLSTMETKEESIYFHSQNEVIDGVPSKIKFPENLFIIGTVNVDETTYMFSPKVLDRAHVIEFRVSDEEMENFLNEPLKPELKDLKGLGKEMAGDFILKSKMSKEDFDDLPDIKSVLLEFFKELKKIGAEFGYRSASEIYRFAGMLNMLTEENGNKWDVNDIVDAAVIQKLLPKVHGSRSKLDPVLKTLAALCYTNKEDYTDKVELEKVDFKDREKIKYPLSLEKILRMRARVIQDGFTSFTEA